MSSCNEVVVMKFGPDQANRKEELMEMLAILTRAMVVRRDTPDGGFAVRLSCDGFEHNGELRGTCILQALRNAGVNVPSGSHACLSKQ
ncbi:hypothetical protein A2397_05215 [Candidatus Amesbacteria bacterium RIFOXYB1_FULL_44_23]|uniref:Uncharacterized protein n=1 Tax=Candidatus Amesbacteria bacterium RIFOXYB1_FULL_44_23 TaxID=1797263 RepID=A0A1F4ZR43_9BACT|nr:MAG: hypothetical protein A2397_05215 [Candidatus Amesbacteria bacterium RIFOXYB1_FULL_44_23]